MAAPSFCSVADCHKKHKKAQKTVIRFVGHTENGTGLITISIWQLLLGATSGPHRRLKAQFLGGVLYPGFAPKGDALVDTTADCV